jgi:hypothetical protein
MENYEIPADVAEKLEGMIAQLDKRSSAERKPSARQVENEVLMTKTFEAMEANRWYAVAECIKEFDFYPSDISPQRVSSLMTKLVENKLVERKVEKRKVYFCKVGA